MSKFKVGDRVVVKDGAYAGMAPSSPYNLPRGEGVVVRGSTEAGFLSVDYDGVVSPPVSPSSFLPAVAPATSGPIRTVTRREIVPGAYGRIKTIEVGHVGISGKAIPVAIDMRFYNAEDLREAAHLFNQLAEVLEEQEAA